MPKAEEEIRPRARTRLRIFKLLRQISERVIPLAGQSSKIGFSYFITRKMTDTNPPAAPAIRSEHLSRLAFVKSAVIHPSGIFINPDVLQVVAQADGFNWKLNIIPMFPTLLEGLPKVTLIGLIMSTK
jgi:hypothetical protein